MQMIFLSVYIILLEGTFGAEETVSVMEGDSVILQTNLTEILNKDMLFWVFGSNEFVISQITRKDDLTSIYITDDEGFNGRVQVDQKTGSLSIRNIRIRHSGQYKLTISRENTTIKTFSVTVFAVVRETDGVKSLSVMEGDSVSLQKDSTELQKGDLIVWRFGDKGLLLAKLDVETNETSLNVDDERFRDRLELDYHTGSLTIRNARTEHTGLYEVQVRGRESSQQFLLSVSALPDQGPSSGAISGIVIGISLLLVASALIYYLWRFVMLKKQQEPKEEPISVMEGDSVTLQTGHTEIQQNETIEWCYEVKENVIAEIKSWTGRKHDGADGRFRSKLSLNANMGDLTVSNTRTIHSGLYILKINNKTTKRFIVTISVRSVSVQEQETVTFPTKAETLRDDLILWTFGAENCLVVRAASDNPIFGDRFRDRVQLNQQTGSLTITNITYEDSGYFKLQIINSEKTRFKRFNVKVSASTGVGSATVLTPLIGGDVPDGENEQQTSSL